MTPEPLDNDGPFSPAPVQEVGRGSGASKGSYDAENVTQRGEVLDLFAGPGGWDVAARALGIDPLGIEKDGPACATRAAAGLRTIQGDVATTVIADDTELWGLIASPPCQTFSSAGKGAGRRALSDVLLAVDLVARGLPVCEFDDPRTALVVQPLRYALLHEPEWLAWEQVSTVLPVWEACAEVLRAEGYSVHTGRFNAEEYGVPQTRKRALLLASRKRKVRRPASTHSRYYSHNPGKLDMGVEKWVSMAEALGMGDGTMTSNYGTGGDARNRGVQAPSPNRRRQSQARSTETSSSSATTRQRTPPCAFGGRMNGVYWQFAGAGPAAERTAGQLPRRHDEPAHTVTGAASAQWVRSDSTPENRREGSVRVTVDEAAVLQSFPWGYPWQGTDTQRYQQVGNAIPPLLALHVLSEVTGIALPLKGEVAA